MYVCCSLSCGCSLTTVFSGFCRPSADTACTLSFLQLAHRTILLLVHRRCAGHLCRCVLLPCLSSLNQTGNPAPGSRSRQVVPGVTGNPRQEMTSAVRGWCSAKCSRCMRLRSTGNQGIAYAWHYTGPDPESQRKRTTASTRTWGKVTHLSLDARAKRLR